MSTSTSLRETPSAAAGQAVHVPVSLPAEPEVLVRERVVLQELFRLVDERAKAEAAATQARVSNDAKVDAEYAKTRQGLIAKYATADQEARVADEQRRRSIIDAALKGEARAKAEFAAVSRRIASEFDGVRENAKVELNRAKNEAATMLESGQKKAAAEHAAAMKPLIDSVAIADGYRHRLATLAALYRKFKLNPDPAAPARESYSKFEDPVDEILNRLTRMEGPLKILEGLIIPKTMMGAREAWVFCFTLPIALGLAIWFDAQPSRARRRRDHWAGSGRLASHLARAAFQGADRAALQSSDAVACRRRCAERLLSRPRPAPSSMPSANASLHVTKRM